MSALKLIAILGQTDGSQLPPPRVPPAISKQRSSGGKVASADNIADASKAILNCYHPTARFRSIEQMEVPWRDQGQFGAVRSMLLRIDYVGISSANYSMTVAVMVRPEELRAHILHDSAKIVASSKCSLKDWKKYS